MRAGARCRLGGGERRRKSVGWLLVAVVAAMSLALGETCTTGVIGRRASADGATFVFGTSDAEQGDFRMARVPATNHPQNATRRVYPLRQNYPHLVAEDRAFTWTKQNLEALPQRSLWNDTKAVGSVPQVNHTYALVESGSGYGLMNEHGLAMGESSCRAAFVSRPLYDGGSALFEVGSLTQLAMERTRTARDAIRLMGETAQKYGYYGAEYDAKIRQDEAGEALTIADGKEAWVFHILGDDTGSSAVWAAQRVPDDSFCVVANRFVIRSVVNGSEDFMLSSNLYDVAARNKLWRSKDGELDFLETFGATRGDTAKYATDRVWRAAQFWAPSLHLNHSRDTDKFPVTMKAELPLNETHILRLLRDHYEGTDLDLTRGIASGPFGDPDRYDKRPLDGTNASVDNASFPRAISMFRTLYFNVQRTQRQLPKTMMARLVVGFHEPSDSVVVPVYVSVDELPPPLTRGSLFAYVSHCLYWRSVLLGNWVHHWYRAAFRPVRAALDEFESAMFSQMGALEEVLAPQLAKREVPESLAKAALRVFAFAEAERASALMSQLFLYAVTTFHDGLYFSNLTRKELSVQSLFYPEFWLREVGFLPPPDEKEHTGARSVENILATAHEMIHASVSSEAHDGAGVHKPRPHVPSTVYIHCLQVVSLLSVIGCVALAIALWTVTGGRRRGYRAL